ncbi:MAG: hypothetical protein LBH04_00690 [Tannerellaceae bacterium]|jgi:hypothetical protein|nr:hypothetical protein [Tannerellaceae bacterium]
MRTFKVHYLPRLDTLEPSALPAFMEENTARQPLDYPNWDEAPEEFKAEAAFQVARSDKRLYIRFIVRGYSLKAVYEEDGSPVYQDSCVEFFMKRPEENIYRNFEFNCIGTCDAARRRSRTDKTPLSRAEYESILRYPSIGHKAFEEIKGIHEWELTVAIPFACMDIIHSSQPEKILGNFYHCADGVEKPRYISWNPVCTQQPDFHRPEFFGEIIF